tara:strand:- start:2166 stop:2753 length:588 start_codon:yes stop_codon:yes gene_type:complete
MNFVWSEIPREVQDQVCVDLMGREITRFQQMVLVDFKSTLDAFQGLVEGEMSPIFSIRDSQWDWIDTLRYQHFWANEDKLDLYSDLTKDSLRAKMRYFGGILSGHVAVIDHLFRLNEEWTNENAQQGVVASSHNKTFTYVKTRSLQAQEDLKALKWFLKWILRLTRQFQLDLQGVNNSDKVSAVVMRLSAIVHGM